VTNGLDAAEAFAYVDNCLEPAARRAFEARLRDSAELRRQIALWESQNSAIRAAYGAPVSARATLDLGSVSNENLPVWMAPAAQIRRAGATVDRGEAGVWPPRAEAVARRASPLAACRRWLAVAALAAGLIVVGASSEPPWPRDKLIGAGLSAYRAFATSAAVEFRASDPETLTKWFAPQFARCAVVPPIASNELTLLGGRIAPGTTAAAAFVIYEDRRGERVGLMIEPFDAPSPSKPVLSRIAGVSVAVWSDARRGFVATGPDREAVLTLIRLIEQTGARRR
jgi:anti-sigma factor RsiW